MAVGGRARRTRTVGAALAVATLLGGALGACSLDVNAGSAAVDDLRAHLADVAGVAEIDATASNDLPFTGSASATVVAEPDLDVAGRDALVDEIAAFLEDAGAGTWTSVDLELDGSSLEVGTDDRANAAALDTLAAALALPEVATASLADTPRRERADVEITTTTGPAAVPTYDAAVALLAGTRWEGRSLGATGGAGLTSFRVTSYDDGAGPSDAPTAQRPDAALAVHAAAARAGEVVGARLAPGVADLRFAAYDGTAALVPGLRAAASAVDPELAVSVQGGTVTRTDAAWPGRTSPDHDGPDVEGPVPTAAEAAAVDTVARATGTLPGVVTLTTSGDVGTHLALAYTVVDRGAAGGVAAAYAALAPGPREVATLVSVRTPEGSDGASAPVVPTFSVERAPDELPAALALLDALAATGAVDELRVRADDVTWIELAGPPGDALRAVVPVARDLLADGRSLHLDAHGDDGSLNAIFTTGPRIEVEARPGESDDEARDRALLERLWNEG